MDLVDLMEQISSADEFAASRRAGYRYVSGRGDKKPAAMLLVDPPGATDNLNGKAASGRHGFVLDALADLAGLRATGSEPNAFITSTAKYRLPPGSKISRGMMESWRGWVNKEWKILGKPALIVTVGAVATMTMLRGNVRISEVAGIGYTPAGIRPMIWPMISPRYAMSDRSIQSTVERHWEELGEWIRKEGLL